MPVWPRSLPQKPLTGTVEIKTESAIASFTPEVGPPMRRRRSTARIEQHSGQFGLSAVQAETLKRFHDISCAEGALTFDAADWRTGLAAKFIFAEPPALTHVSTTRWTAQVALIKLP